MAQNECDDGRNREGAVAPRFIESSVTLSAIRSMYKTEGFFPTGQSWKALGIVCFENQHPSPIDLSSFILCRKNRKRLIIDPVPRIPLLPLSSRNTNIPFRTCAPRGATRTCANRCTDVVLHVYAPAAENVMQPLQWSSSAGDACERWENP